MSLAFIKSFRGKRVFVTGHTGFKGSWLCIWLNELGATVTGYALEPPTDPNHFEISNVESLLTDHHVADVRDGARLAAAIKAAQPDVILHLAAQSVVRTGYSEPRETFDINVMGMVSVLDAVRQYGRPVSVVAVTSDKCYENREQVWGYRECDAMGEYDPYGASKGAAELVARCYRESFFHPSRLNEHGVKMATARAGNVIGGGDWTSHALIVDIVKSLSKGEPVALRNPGALRPWQHVLQALSGYLTLAAKLLESDDPQYMSGWNFGPVPGNEIPVREIVERFHDVWGCGEWTDASEPGAPHESTILRLSIDKALWQLGWRPGWNIDETLRQTARWYRAYIFEQQDMLSFSRSQIRDYTDSTTANAPLLPSLG